MSPPQPFNLAEMLRRALAAGCAGLVLVLTIFAASPVAHEWLHAVEKRHTCNDHPAPAPTGTNGDHTCAVVLFAHGVDLPVAPFALTPPRFIAQSVSPVTAAEFYLVSPRYLRHPERGPPSLG